MVNIEIYDNLKEIKSKVGIAVEAIAFNTEGEIKKAFTSFPKPPIKTGNLRRNIKSNKISENHWNVTASTPLKSGKGGKTVEYAVFIEYGTYKMAPRPFMRIGIKNSSEKNLQILKKLMEL